MGLGVIGRHRIEQFQPFGLDLLFDILVLGPREAHAVGLGMDAVGLCQRRQAARQAVIGPLGAFGVRSGLFLAFDAVPVLELFGLVFIGRVAENVGMAAYHLGGFDFERVGEGRAARAAMSLPIIRIRKATSPSSSTISAVLPERMASTSSWHSSMTYSVSDSGVCVLSHGRRPVR